MARVRSRHTSPELSLRRALHAAGLRYRLHGRLPGSPDIVLSKARLAIFVHGCFWHSHPACKRARTPSTRQDYWIPKLARNVERDRSSIAALEGLGWRVIVVWECETKGDRLFEHVQEIASASRAMADQKCFPLR